MQPPERELLEQTLYRLLQANSQNSISGNSHGFDNTIQKNSVANGASQISATGYDQRHTCDPSNGLTQPDNLVWESPKLDQISDVTSRIPDSSQSSTPSWEGSLWSGSNNNIWSTGPSTQVTRTRRSVDVPSFVRTTLPGQSSADRRSLDSLNAFQAIWQAKQQQQQQQHQLDLHSQLRQQMTQLGLQDGSNATAPSRPGIPQQHSDFPYPSGPDGLQFQPQDLGISRGLSHNLAGLTLSPSGFAQASGGQRMYQGISQPPNAGIDLASSNHSDIGNGAGTGNGLLASQLQGAFQDPASLSFFRQRMEAARTLSPQMNRPQNLEDLVALARQQATNSLGSGAGANLRQPPPPPPRSGRPQLPPMMAIQPPTSLRPPVNSKKANTSSNGTRSTGRDRTALLGSKPKADMAVLNTALEELVESLRPSAEELQRQQEAFRKVARILTARWPHARVEQFGSTANSLSICNNNDIDVCIEMAEAEGDENFKSQLVEEMGDLLMDAGMANVLPLPKARVPVVKFAVPETGTKVDVTVNNVLAMVNTRLLRDYAAVDGRLAKLAFVVKHWAKRRQVNDSYRGTLSSYCYVLMAIHHLQSRQPPVLPCLQAIQPPTHVRSVGNWCCDYHDRPMPDFGQANRETLADLVWSFFENWAWGHDYNNAVVSVRTASLLTKSQKDWTRRIGNERHLICIEDPFETSHDLGRTVDRQTSGVLHKEFERAAALLRDQAEPLAHLLEPYRVGKE